MIFSSCGPRGPCQSAGLRSGYRRWRHSSDRLQQSIVVGVVTEGGADDAVDRARASRKVSLRIRYQVLIGTGSDAIRRGLARHPRRPARYPPGCCRVAPESHGGNDRLPIPLCHLCPWFRAEPRMIWLYAAAKSRRRRPRRATCIQVDDAMAATLSIAAELSYRTSTAGYGWIF